MRDFRARALLDRPSPDSLGMLGLVISEGYETSLRSEGLVSPRNVGLDAMDFRDLVSGGHGVEIEEMYVEGLEDARFVALWAGDRFLEQAESLGLGLPPLPKTTTGRIGIGTYWIAPSRHVFTVIDAWIMQAFRRVATERDHQLARIMLTASGSRIEARAAVWLTSSPAERQRELKWWTRLELDAGRRNATPASLESELQQFVVRASLAPPEVMGLCAPAKGGDNEIARREATARGVRRASFGDWLRHSAQLRGDSTDRLHLQRMGQNMLDARGALFFCLEVMSEARIRPQVDGFVIDGIRHVDVLESLRYLVGPDRFTLTSVNRPEVLRRRLLMQEEHLPADAVERVLRDETEREVPKVQSRASALAT